MDKPTDKKEKRIIEAKLLETYIDPDSGKKVYHPRADYKRNQHGEPDESAGKGGRVLVGGHQTFNTGAQGGPAIDLNFTDWTVLPDSKGGLFLARFLRSDPYERMRVVLRTRPAFEDTSDIMDDPGIEHLDAPTYTKRHREELSAKSAENTMAPPKRGPGRPPGKNKARAPAHA